MKFGKLCFIVSAIFMYSLTSSHSLPVGKILSTLIKKTDEVVIDGKQVVKESENVTQTRAVDEAIQEQPKKDESVISDAIDFGVEIYEEAFGQDQKRKFIDCPDSPAGPLDIQTSLNWNDCIGLVNFPNKEKYVGEFVSGFPNGRGVYLYEDGSLYVGQWQNGMRHGQGIMTYKFPSLSPYTNGSRNEGKWKAGVFVKQNVDRNSAYPYCLNFFEINTKLYERCLQMCEKSKYCSK